MSSPNIHWHEGLFLQPHHLQQFQRNVHQSIRRERRLAWPYAYGVVEMRLSLDDLENYRIRFEKLHVVMPSGHEVVFPSNAELPSLDIKAAFSQFGADGFFVNLGLPLWYAARANTAPLGSNGDSKDKLQYRVVEEEFADENTGDNPRPLLMRRLNARLMLEQEDRSDMEIIPLLRVKRAVGQDLSGPRQDTGFIPPTLTLNGAPALLELVKDLSSQIDASRKELLIQVNRGGFNPESMRGLQFEQILRLRSLSRANARLSSLLGPNHLAPFVYYIELREILADLMSLQPNADDRAVPAYDHDNPAPAFHELSSTIRSLLGGVHLPSFMKLPFTRDGAFLKAAFTEEHFTAPNDYLIGVRTSKVDPREIARLVEDPDKFKFMATSFGNRAIRGIVLKEERFPPLELPAQTGLHYFRVLRSESTRMWDAIRSEKNAVLRWPGLEESDFEVTLFMTVATPKT